MGIYNFLGNYNCAFIWSAQYITYIVAYFTEYDIHYIVLGKAPFTIEASRTFFKRSFYVPPSTSSISTASQI